MRLIMTINAKKTANCALFKYQEEELLLYNACKLLKTYRYVKKYLDSDTIFIISPRYTTTMDLK